MKPTTFGRRGMWRLAILAGAGFAVVLYGATAPTNDLGSEKPYGIVSSTYTNTAGGTNVTGGVCFTTGPDVAPTVSGSYGACPAAAGTDQSEALAELNHVSQNCTVLGAGPLEGMSINGGAAGTFPPGCYERADALDISVNGIVTLDGVGVYIFKSTGGALTTGANSQIVLSGACANNVFWAPVGLTTLGASSTFIGNILDAAGVTMGLNATMTGRALAFGGTVTTNGNTITVPADCPAATHLVINKVVVNNSGGVLTPTSFAGNITGAVVATGGNTWAGASTDRTLTQVGAYNVTENALAGYTATFSADCSGTIAAGETRTCTITNTDNATHLIINKVVVNDSGGVLTPAAFSGTVTGVVVATGGNTWTGASTDLLLTTAGAYTVTETAQPGYTATFSAGCSGTIPAGSTVTCTITNTDNPTHLIINKVVVNNSGGVLTPAAFSGTIGGDVVATGGNTWAGASTDRLLTTVGAYSVAETAHADYTSVLSADCSGTIAVGETRTCTVTNSDTPTHLIINKVVVNNSGGVLTPAAFSGTISGNVVATGGNTWTGASTDRLLTRAGTYSVTETAHAGYTSVLSADCSGTIAAGETKTCTVTNSDAPTHLIINKVVVNNSGGVLTPAAFSGTISGNVVATGGNTWTGASTDRLLTRAGTYSVAETAHAGYTVVLSADCSGTIAAGETKTCTVTNTDILAVPTLPQTLVLLLGLGLTGLGYFQLRRRVRV